MSISLHLYFLFIVYTFSKKINSDVFFVGRERGARQPIPVKH